jgi:predicted branched-subunit amino acid permease
MKLSKKKWFLRGIKDGLPIALGYFAVSFTLGIAAKNAGLTAVQAMLASLTNNASAGEFAGFTLIAANAGYFEMAVMIFIANARYLLMSCALSQKLSPETSLTHRMLIGYDVTDEIFGIAISVPGRLEPLYTYGAFTVAIPGWGVGTFLGVLMGNILPANIVSALSVGLYGMFIAIIVPPARRNKIIAGLIILSMVASYALATLPVISTVSSGIRTIILTVIISAAAAILFPVKEAKEEHAA